MNHFDSEFEKAIRFITNAMPPAEELEKPTLFHSIRVGVYLYNHGYNREVCLAGLLHDSIEDTRVTQTDIENNFGKEVAELVAANSKNETLAKDIIYKKLLEQCIEYGEDALIIKAADILDNHIYYTKINEPEGLHYTRTITKLLLEMKPKEFQNKIFNELENIVK
jgi:(p)ppGpp synthase/HD superfamily hydrolase